MSSKDVAFVLVPGSFSPTSFYDKVTYLLGSQGYITVPTELKSAAISSTRPQPASMADDTAYIRETITTLLDQGKNVVLALNSYAGFPGSEAVQGLTRGDRFAEHKEHRGALIGLVYLASFLPEVGQSIGDIQGANSLPPDFYTEADYMKLATITPEYSPFSALTLDETRYYNGAMLNQSRISFADKLTYPGYLHIPSTFVIPNDDRIIPTQRQHAMIDAAIEKGAKVRTVTVNADHVIMLSRPDVVARVLLEAAGELDIVTDEM